MLCIIIQNFVTIQHIDCGLYHRVRVQVSLSLFKYCVLSSITQQTEDGENDTFIPYFNRNWKTNRGYSSNEKDKRNVIRIIQWIVNNW